MPERDWMVKAACRGVDPAVFFPNGGDPSHARSICRTCPVSQECADYADATKAAFGVWAGEYRSEPRKYHPIADLKPCGTEAAYRRHHRRGEPACERCSRAHQVLRVERREAAG